ncbi:MAG: hypothetical protein R3D30_06680 [Hyphomicrobiales bacterium]
MSRGAAFARRRTEASSWRRPAVVRLQADACGIVVAGGLGETRGGDSARRPDAAGRAADGLGAGGDQCVRRYEADRIVVEVNQGGDLVEAVLRQVDASVLVRISAATQW